MVERFFSCNFFAFFIQLSHNIVHTAQYHGLSLCYFYRRQASAGPVTFVATSRHRDHDNEASLPFWSELSSVFFSQQTSLFAARKDHVTRDRQDIEHNERHDGAHRHPFGRAASP